MSWLMSQLMSQLMSRPESEPAQGPQGPSLITGHVGLQGSG
jgi:hypothetical protein